MMRMRTFVPLLVVVMAACAGADADDSWGGTMRDSADITIVENPRAADWHMTGRPTVAEALRIGAGEGAPEYQFATIGAVDIGADGTIYVLDQQAAQVRVFDAGGRYVRTIGSPGDGPGELSPSTAALMVGAGDSVYVADMMKQRIHRFAPDGTEAGGVAVPLAAGIPVSWGITPDHRFVTQLRVMELTGAPAGAPVARGEPPRDLIVMRNARGELVDTLLVLESGRTFDFSGGIPAMRLFEAEPMWALLSDGRLVYGRNDAYRLHLLDADGSVERIITKPFERSPVTEADRNALLGILRQSMQGRAGPQAIEQFLSRVQFADHYPAYARIMGGPQGTIWVQHIRTAEMAEQEGREFDPQEIGAREWDIFDEEGRLLGVLTLPERFQPLRIVGDEVYGVQRDELDVQHLVKLRVTGL